MVTIMTTSQVEKKKATQWQANFKFGVPDTAKAQLQSVKPIVKSEGSSPIRLANPPLKTFLISYIPVRDQAVRQYEEFTTADEVEKRLTEVQLIPGSLHVYKEVPLGIKILG